MHQNSVQILHKTQRTQVFITFMLKKKLFFSSLLFLAKLLRGQTLIQSHRLKPPETEKSEFSNYNHISTQNFIHCNKLGKICRNPGVINQLNIR